MATNCPAYATYRGRCTKHATQAKQQRTVATGDRFYSLKPWRDFRAWFLARHPVCMAFLHVGGTLHGFTLTVGDVTTMVPITPTTPSMCFKPATQVDHILPRRTHPELAFVEGNCRALCHPCHSRRTAREQSGWRERA